MLSKYSGKKRNGLKILGILPLKALKILANNILNSSEVILSLEIILYLSRISLSKLNLLEFTTSSPDSAVDKSRSPDELLKSEILFVLH